MAKKYLIFLSLVFCISGLKAQQYGLFNTRTLFDGFENPAQKTFVLDSSRKFASNFFLPYLGVNAANQGNSDFIRTLLNTSTFTAKNVPLGKGEINTIHENSNVYVLAFKIFQSYKYQKEIGLSWQIRSDVHLNYTNETLAILDNYKRFTDNPSDFNNAFNNNGFAQSYHQFSLSYRENYNKRLAFGVKLSLLSGITYNKLNITKSNFNLSPDETSLMLQLTGSYEASFLRGNDLSKKDILPLFKNPGAAISFGTSYKAKSGVFLMANVKDLGVIRWSKKSYTNYFNERLVIDDLESNTSSEIEKKITDIAINNPTHNSFYALTNAKADFMISKPISYYYTPSLIVSKNLFYKGGDVAFVNKFSYNEFSVSAIPAYNFNKLFLFGMQGMYQTANFEAFMGSDNLFKTFSQINGAIKQDASIGSGYNGASFYMGIGIKFGNTVEHPQNSSTMPGVGDESSSFFKRLFSVFSKKKP